jgi:hypothetical protein
MKFCSSKCRNSHGGKTHRLKDLIENNNNVDRFLLRLKNQVKERENLSLKFLKNLYNSQDGKCALSGIKMTAKLHSGKVNTNISIDRIDSNLGYSENNVQLVCYIVNMMKSNLPMETFISYCSKISETSSV